jgi:hypothetical protein
MPWITIILILLFTAFALALKYLPWWGIVIMIAVPLLTWKYIAALVFTLMVRRFAGQLAQALAGAETEVHSVKPVAPPGAAALEQMLAEGDDAEDQEFKDSLKDAADEPPEARNWYELDVSIRPQPTLEGQDNPGWPADGLMLIAPGGNWGEIDDVCFIGKVERRAEGEFRPAANWHAHDSERLRFLIGVKPGTRKLIFQYMTEQFGDVIELPPPLLGSRPPLTE